MLPRAAAYKIKMRWGFHAFSYQEIGLFMDSRKFLCFQPIFKLNAIPYTPPDDGGTS